MDPLLSVSVGEDGVVDAVASPGIQEDISNVETAPLQGLLGLSNPTGHELGEMKVIWEYLREVSTGVGDLLYQFRQLENRMSPPKLGESRLGKVYNYVTIQSKVKQYEKELESM